MAAFAPTPFALAALATAAVPELTLVSVRPGPENPNFHYAVARDNIGRAWVIRMPRHDIAGASQEGEIALLQSLAAAAAAGGLPFEVPRPRGYAPLPDGGRAIVYPKPPGEPMALGSLEPGPGLASNLGRALAALHELPATIIENAGLPSYTAEACRARLQSELDEAARTGQIPVFFLSRWERYFDDVRLWRFNPTVTHGDIASENLLAEHGRVATIISFTQAQVGDPAEDLARVIAEAGPETSTTVLESYRQRRTERTDDHLTTRAEFLVEFACVRWLMFGVRHHDEEIVADARTLLVELEQSIADEEAAEAERIRLEAAAAAERKRIAEQTARAEAERLASQATEAARAKLAAADATGLGAAGGPGASGEAPTQVIPSATTPPVRTSVSDHGISVWGARSPDPPPQWNDIINSVEDIPPAPGVLDATQRITGGPADTARVPAAPEPEGTPSRPGPTGPDGASLGSDTSGPDSASPWPGAFGAASTQSQPGTTRPESASSRPGIAGPERVSSRPGTTGPESTPPWPGTTGPESASPWPGTAGLERTPSQPGTTGPERTPLRAATTGPQPGGVYSQTGTTGSEPSGVYSRTGTTRPDPAASQPAGQTESRASSAPSRMPVWATVPTSTGGSTPRLTPGAAGTPEAPPGTSTPATSAARELADTDPGAPSGTQARLAGDDSPTAVHPPVV